MTGGKLESDPLCLDIVGTPRVFLVPSKPLKLGDWHPHTAL